MISTDNANVTALSILSGIPSHSNLVQNQTSDLAEQALLVYCCLKHLQPCPLADAKAPFQWSHNLPLQSHPIQLICSGEKIKIKTSEYNPRSIYYMMVVSNEIESQLTDT